MAYHPFRHLGLKFLSACLAMLLWVTVARDPTVERTLRVPLQFQNIPERLQVVGSPPSSVDVRVRGASGAVARLQPGEVVAVLDLQSAKQGSRLFHLMAEQVRTPFGVVVAQVAPPTVALEFERTGRRSVPVVPAYDGEPAPGYVIGTLTADPAQVEVGGPESHLRTVREATTEPVSVAGATETVRDEVNIGVADSEVRLVEVRSARVTISILPVPIESVVRGVPVRLANVRNGLRANALPAVVAVTVRGTRELIGRVDAAALEARVDLAGLQPGRYNLPVRVESTRPIGISRVDPAVVEVRLR